MSPAFFAATTCTQGEETSSSDVATGDDSAQILSMKRHTAIAERAWRDPRLLVEKETALWRCGCALASCLGSCDAAGEHPAIPACVKWPCQRLGCRSGLHVTRCENGACLVGRPSGLTEPACLPSLYARLRIGLWLRRVLCAVRQRTWTLVFAREGTDRTFKRPPRDDQCAMTSC